MPEKTCKKCGETKDIVLFSKHCNTADKLDNRCKECVKKMKQKAKTRDSEEYPTYYFDMDSTEWQVGKPTGCILHRIDKKSNAERYEVRIPLGKGKNKSKSFAFKKYKTPEIAREEANKWMKEFSAEKKFDS